MYITKLEFINEISVPKIHYRDPPVKSNRFSRHLEILQMFVVVWFLHSACRINNYRVGHCINI